MTCIESFTAGAQLRKIDSAIDFTHIYDSVKEPYWPDNDRHRIFLYVILLALKNKPLICCEIRGPSISWKGTAPNRPLIIFFTVSE